MDRYDRQIRIPGWDQRRLDEACVVVYGRDFLGCFTVWALASLGIGEIVWIGTPRKTTAAVASWFLAEPCPFSGCTISDYPFQIEYGNELVWALGQRRARVLVHCEEDPFTQRACLAFAQARQVKFVAGTGACGGWQGCGGIPPDCQDEAQEPITAMAVAALLADSVREILCPLAGGLLAPDGPVGFQLPRFTPRGIGKVVLIGVGGIGVYVATLAALLGFDTCLVDFDQVEASNLNRQGLFTAEDVQQRTPKAVAAQAALSRLFSQGRVSADVRRVDADFKSILAKMHPAALLSAVDNARTRLLLQSLGHALNLPVIQGATSLFAADCYTQSGQGPLLNAQMHGALSEAVGRESSQARQGSCAADPSYVVPGMMAGALIAYRLIQVCALYQGLPPILWRSGNLPTEKRSGSDGFNFAELTS